MDLEIISTLELSGDSDKMRAQREKFDVPLLDERIRELRLEQLKAVEAEIQIQCLKALKAADSFREKHMRQRTTGKDAERGGRFMCSARMRNQFQLEISWNENHFIGAKGSRRVLSRRIKKPKGQMKHRLSDFSGCNEWEKSFIAFTEEVFSEVRTRMASLQKTRNELRHILSK